MRRTALACAGLSLMVATLAGCGDDGEASPGAASPTADSTPSASPSPSERTTSSAPSPRPSATITGPDASFCAAALEAGLATSVEELRGAIDQVRAELPSRAGDEVAGGLRLLAALYAEAEDLVSAGEAYADAEDAAKERMNVYFEFQRKTCEAPER